MTKYDDNGLRPGSDVHVHTSGGGGSLPMLMAGVLVVALVIAGAVGAISYGPEAQARAEVIARTPVPTPTPVPEVVESRNQTELNYQASLRVATWIGLACIGSLVAVWVYATSVRNTKSAAQQPVRRLHRTDPSYIGWDQVLDPVGGGVTYLSAGEKEPHVEYAQLVAQNFSAAAAWQQVIGTLIAAQQQRQLTGPEYNTLERGLTRLEQLESGQ